MAARKNRDVPEESDEGGVELPAGNAREVFHIKPPNFTLLVQPIEGAAPYVQARFSDKARHMMQRKQQAGTTSKKGQAKEARDFDADFEGSLHRGPGGKHGIPAAAFRAAAISACRTVGFKMTLAKLGLFVEADFTDPRDGTPLVAIKGKPKPLTLPVRNATGVADLRVRGIWLTWSATLRLKFDADMFTTSDVVNLLARIGEQVGIGEGRADSKKSAGMGWGFFRLAGEGTIHKAA